MAKKPIKQALSDAKKYYRLLLYDASGGSLGVKPEGTAKLSTATFAEKRGLLDSIIKISEIERKNADDEPEESGLDLIRKELNGGRTSRRGRGARRATEDSTVESDTFPDTSGEAEESPDDA